MATWISDERARSRAAAALDDPTPRRDGELIMWGRRSFMRGALAGVAGAVLGTQLSGCSAASSRPAAGEREQNPPSSTATGRAVPAATGTVPAATGSKVLVAYFSRAGEN